VVDAILAPADAAMARHYPGERAGRTPVHTVYVPADRVQPGLAATWGSQARDALLEHAPDAESLAVATGLDDDVVLSCWDRLLAKLDTEPVEDLRIDLEDGYGRRPGEREDADVVRAVRAVAQDALRGAAPPWWGIRFASFEPLTRHRGLRTLDLAVAAALEVAALPEGFVVTLPKVTSVEQVRAMVEVCRRLETAYGLAEDGLRFEVQVETPQAVLNADGTATVARLVHEGGRRLVGLHFGTYDYSAALGVPSAYQSLEHPAADHAKAVMQLAAAGTGVRVADGSTNVLPVGEPDQVRAAWRLHTRLVRRSLRRGLYQGWDLHPAQLVTRHLAVATFFREGLDDAGQRLRAYTERRSGGVLDEPATAQALAAFLLRALDCGAIGDDEARSASGLDRAGLDALVQRARTDR
jgi:citrate lyase beta subunit